MTCSVAPKLFDTVDERREVRDLKKIEPIFCCECLEYYLYRRLTRYGWTRVEGLGLRDVVGSS
jgi:hypothetical protein